jgi:hypothetical protein
MLRRRDRLVVDGSWVKCHLLRLVLPLLVLFTPRGAGATPPTPEPAQPLPQQDPARALAVATPTANRPPVISGVLPGALNRDEVYVPLGQPLSLTLVVNDLDGDRIELRVVPLPSGAQFDVDSRTLRWTPHAVGDHVLRFVATDGSLESSHTMLLHVTAPAAPRMKPVRPPVGGPQRSAETFERSWESYLLPGAGYAVYAPRGAGIGAFGGLTLQVVIAAWIHQNDNRGPSHGRVYMSTELLQGNADQPLLFVYTFGTSLSFERNPRRAWLVPHYGVDFGGLISDTLGNHFQTTPYLGVHAFASPNLFASVRGGYRLLPGELERLGGLHVAGAVEFSIW